MAKYTLSTDFFSDDCEKLWYNTKNQKWGDLNGTQTLV